MPFVGDSSRREVQAARQISETARVILHRHRRGAAPISPIVSAQDAFPDSTQNRVLGGMFGPTENLPDALQTVSSWLPFGAAVEAFQSAWLGESVEMQNWLVLGGSAVVGAAVAGALFRWD